MEQVRISAVAKPGRPAVMAHRLAVQKALKVVEPNVCQQALCAAVAVITVAILAINAHRSPLAFREMLSIAAMVLASKFE